MESGLTYPPALIRTGAAKGVTSISILNFTQTYRYSYVTRLGDAAACRYILQANASIGI
jgi:hypothetical protein